MKIIFLLLLVQLGAGSLAFAQEGAPQEAPYIQEDNEFDVFSNEGTPMSEEAEAASIESEISKPAEKKEAVNLNEESDKKIEEDLILEEDNKVAVPETEPLPFEEPVVEDVRPQQKIRRSGKTTKSAKGGVEYIQHPQAEKGLVLITKEGAYVYKTTEAKPYKQSGAFRFAMMDAPKITAADGETTFSEMYSGGQQPIIGFDFDWQPFQGFGKLGIQAGFGIMYASGNGRFVTTDVAAGETEEAEEKYTFLAIPLSLGLSYRLEVWDRQWVAPYVSAGGTYIGVAELRDDGKGPSLVGTPGAYGGGGLMLNISAMNRNTAFTLRTEYGIQNLWVSLDAKYLATFSEDLDFTSAIIGGGIVCDY